MERMRDKGEFERLTKKEAMLITREIERLEILLGGIRSMARLPELLFVVDVHREATAIHEANLLKIPVVAMVDTNCDPRDVDYVIPSNDDAIRAIKLLVGKMADAVLEGKALRKDMPEEERAYELGAVMPGADERELSDEELLGEATLAKISFRTPVVEFEEVIEIAAEEEQELEVAAEEEVVEDLSDTTVAEDEE
jgi:small subunit ribosomal protein S2